jgi:hypothetical protein
LQLFERVANASKQANETVKEFVHNNNEGFNLFETQL